MVTVVITGANRGIGLALTQAYLAVGAQVVAVCRRASPELTALKPRIIEGVELTDPDGIARVAEQVAGEGIDILINNAAILRSTSLGQLAPEALAQQFQVNAVAPLLLSQALLPSLAKGAKLVFITSRMGSIADNGSGGNYGYRMSKAALNAGAKSLAVDLRSRGIAVGIYHPGFVKTDMVGGAGDVTPAEAARQLMARVADLTLERSGEFLHARGEPLPW